MYVPNPVRCRKCLRFGHFADSCSKAAICGFCSSPEHTGSPCATFIPTCVNCKENHSSLDFKCPRFLEEKEIKTIQFREKIPYNAAKKQYRESVCFAANKSYAETARNSRKGVEVACQTEDSSPQPPIVKKSTASRITASPPLQAFSSPSPPLPLPPSPSPPLPLSPSYSPPPIPPSPTPSTSLPSFPQDEKEGEKNMNIRSPLPRRNSSQNGTKKYKKNKNNNSLSGEEMESNEPINHE